MNYTKPEVINLGSAKELIEVINNAKTSPVNDNGQPTNPAYDLDE